MHLQSKVVKSVVFTLAMPDCSPAHIFTQNARTHTICYAAASPH